MFPMFPSVSPAPPLLPLFQWKCGNSITEYVHIMRNEKTGQVACKVSGKLVYVNQERIICDIPDFIRQQMERTEHED